MHRPAGRCTLMCLGSTPIVVHQPSQTGIRRVTVHRHGRDEILGLAHSDYDLILFLEAMGRSWLAGHGEAAACRPSDKPPGAG